MKKNKVKEKKVRDDWYKLDNAAKIYPGTNNGRWNAVYRVCAVMKEKVDNVVLQKALDVVVERYPAFNVVLRKGVFWYFFQGADVLPKVRPEQTYPCQKFNIDSREPLFRVMYSQNRIIIEFSHCVTDGYGSLNFLNTLILKYLHIHGKELESDKVFHYKDEPLEEEVEDSYLRYYEPNAPRQPKKEKAAYHLPGTTELDGVLNVVHGEVSTEQLKAVAKENGATINQYILAVVTYACYLQKQLDHDKKKKRPIRVQSGINLRGMLPSKTLRNFAAIANVQLSEDIDNMTFEQVLEVVKKECDENFTVDAMRGFINSNCSIETNILLKLVPLFLKNLGMKLAFYKVGDKVITMAVSNFGKIVAPSEYVDYVDRYEFIIGGQKYNRNALTVGGYNDRTVFTFSRRMKSAVLERDFFRFLADKGIDVLISSNKGGGVNE